MKQASVPSATIRGVMVKDKQKPRLRNEEPAGTRPPEADPTVDQAAGPEAEPAPGLYDELFDEPELFTVDDLTGGLYPDE